METIKSTLCAFLCLCCIANISAQSNVSDLSPMPICSGMSCKDRCTRVRKTAYECSCDDHCHYYGDCCQDHFDTCYSQSKINPYLLKLMQVVSANAYSRNIEISGQSAMADHLFASLLNHDCMQATHWVHKFPPLLIIDQCPAKEDSDSSSLADRERCEHPDQNNMAQVLPVCNKTSKVVYRNAYCASCHGLNSSSPNLLGFNMTMRCNHPIEIYETMNMSDVRWSQTCRYDLNAPLYMGMNHGDPRCSAFSESHLKSGCPKERKGSLLHALCKAFIMPVQSTSRAGTVNLYKNPFCAFCNGAKLKSLKCRTFAAEAIPTTKLIVLPAKLHPSAVSTISSVSDPTRHCRFTTASPDVDNPYRYTFQMLFDFRNDYSVKLKPEKPSTTALQSSLPICSSHLVITNEEFRSSDLINLTVEYTVNLKTISPTNTSLILDNFAFINENISITSSNYSRETCAGNISTSGEYVLTFDLGVDIDGVVQATERLMRNWNGSVNLITASIGRSVTFGNLNLSYCGYEKITVKDGFASSNTREYLDKQWHGHHSESLTWKRPRCYSDDIVEISRRCLGDIDISPSCHLKILDAESYDLDNSPDYLTRLGTAEALKHGNQYYTLQCGSEHKDPSTDADLYVVGVSLMSVSLIALLLTFFTYVIFGELRTLPGICVMHLVFCLTIIHANYLLFVSKQVPQPAEWLCMGLALSMHVMWLAAFSWQSALALNLAWSLNHLAVSEGETRYLPIFTGLCWGVPLLVVALFATLDHFGIVPVGYGLDGICWIRKYNGALLYLFALPMGLSLMTNLVCFVFSFRAIYKINRLARGLGIVKTKKGQLLLCVKIFILLGATWAFVIVANAVNEKLFWTVETVVNATQGAFLSGVLMLNTTVFNLYKKAMLGCIKGRFPSKYVDRKGIK